MPSPAAPGADAEPAHVVGLLLAAGEGRRMGTPKGLLRLEAAGPTLTERAVAALVAGGCRSVTVVVGAAAEQVAAVAVASGATVVEAPDWSAGMGSSLRAGLVSIDPSRYAAALVHLVDLPDVGADVVARVLAAGLARAGLARAGLARAAYGGRPGHPVLIGSDHWPGAMVAARGDRGARDFLAGADVALIECGDLASGRDADRPDDLAPPGR